MKTVTQQEMLNSVGTVLAPTDWFTITQQQINAFADCTHDHQFIHVDEQQASQTPFGSTIAHGFLTLSMLSHFAESFSLQVEGVTMGINYGFDKVRFIAPVAVNSRIRCHAKVLAVSEDKPHQFKVTHEVIIEIEGNEKPALIAHWIGLQLVSDTSLHQAQGQ